MINIDLHTHSTLSHDGGISADGYKQMLAHGVLDYIAITDHNTIDFAVKMHAELGDKIIVGEEIMTSQGEIIGLHLKKPVASGLTLVNTVQEIKSQGGIVYVPHPFEKLRSGISVEDLEEVADQIDIIEAPNGRVLFGEKTKLAHEFAAEHNLPTCASSDAHGWHGWGRTYTQILGKPSLQSLAKLIGNSHVVHKKPSLRAILYPKYNKLRKIWA